jgi:hypothetical protein
MPPTSPHWTPQEEDVFISNLEAGCTPRELARFHERTEKELMIKIIELFSEGVVVVLSAAAFDALLRRSSQ